MALVGLFGEHSVVPAKETFQKHGVKHLSSRDGCFVQEERKQDVSTTVDAKLRIAVHLIFTLSPICCE